MKKICNECGSAYEVEGIIHNPQTKNKFCNEPIPLLVYRGSLSYGKGRVFNSTTVKYLQRALQSLGYYRGHECDGWFGGNTVKAVIELKKKLKLSLDYNLNEADYHKINKALIDNYHLYRDSEYGINKWGIPKNGKYTWIATKINPDKLNIDIQDKSADRYSGDNLITSSYQWLQYNGKYIMHKYGVSISNKKVLLDGQVHYKPSMTLFSRGKGHFDVKTVNYAKELGIGVNFADAGLELYPNSMAHISSGFVGRYSDVLRRTARPFNFKYNGELYFAVHPSMDSKLAYRTGKEMVFGWINTWDAGGSTFLKIMGKVWYSTSRRLYQMVKF